MPLFYDPHDIEDQKRIEAILSENMIPYSLHPEPVTGRGPMQIYLSEKDVRLAEELIMHHEDD